MYTVKIPCFNQVVNQILKRKKEKAWLMNQKYQHAYY